MAVTRSGKDTAQSAQVSNAKSGASQEVDARYRYSVKHKAAKRKYVDLDKTALALGWFLDTWRKVNCKDNPEFILTVKDYQGATAKFNLLSEGSKNDLAAKAKKSYSIEDNGLPVSASMDKSKWDYSLKNMGMNVYLSAVWKSHPGPTLPLELENEAYKDYDSLGADGKAPYVAEAIRIYLIGKDDLSKLTPLERLVSIDYLFL